MPRVLWGYDENCPNCLGRDRLVCFGVNKLLKTKTNRSDGVGVSFVFWDDLRSIPFISNNTAFHLFQTKTTAQMEKDSTQITPRRRGGDAVPPFSRKDSTGSGGSGNNSDNSAVCSIGYNSFGFNFDAEEGMITATEEQQDSQAADNAVANLASIASEAQGKPVQRIRVLLGFDYISDFLTMFHHSDFVYYSQFYKWCQWINGEYSCSCLSFLHGREPASTFHRGEPTSTVEETEGGRTRR